MSLTNPNSVITVERLADFWSQIRTPLDAVNSDLTNLRSQINTALNGIGIPYGTCETASNVQGKTVTVSPAITSLVDGQIIIIRFLYSNTAGLPTLNVNSLGDRNLVGTNGNFAGITIMDSWSANQAVLFRFTMTGGGGHWVKLTQSFPVNTYYPIGSFYWSANDTSPAELFGGTWAKIEGVFLWARRSTDTLNSLGGEIGHTLSESELPQIQASFVIHGQERGTIFYHKNGKATGTETSVYMSPGTGNNSGATSLQNPGISFGSGAAHNNMPPYKAVNCWQRLS